jgi:hypothetical protein
MSNIPHPRKPSAAESSPRRCGLSVFLAHFRREIGALIRPGEMMSWPMSCHDNPWLQGKRPLARRVAKVADRVQ